MLAGLGAGAAVLAAWTSAAFGAPNLHPFFPTHVPVVLSATDSSGTRVAVTVDVLDVSLVPDAEAPSQLSALPTGEEYLKIWLKDADGQNPFVPLAYPLSAVTLEVNGSTVAPAGFAPDPPFLEAQWYFAVPHDLTAATLQLAAVTVTSPNGDGTSTTYAIAPGSIAFTTQGPSQVPGAPTAGTNTADAGRHAAGSVWPIGLGLGALTLGAGAVGARPYRRWRFARAHRKGRVRIIAPPLTTERSSRVFVVQILGPLVITGTGRRTEELTIPVKELAVYFVLSRDRSYSTLELVERIWGVGRTPVSPDTVRSYLSDFRKVFGTDVLRRRGFTYTVTAVIGCDLDDYQVEVAAPDQPAGALRALSLVRGRTLEGSFVKAKNNPFEWAASVASRIDRTVVYGARDTTESLLGAERFAEADVACSAGLRAQPTNLDLRLLDLETGYRTGGQAELARLKVAKAAMADFPEDVATLEERARQLGLADAEVP